LKNNNLYRDTAERLRVGGVVPFTTVDFPGRLAAVVFCQGCAWRCAYCHNPHLLPRRGEARVPWRDVRALLQRRRGLLDAVVFSGGEPTLQPALPAALRVARAMGYATGLHTAGMHPRRLRAALPLLDWVGIDVKAPFRQYAGITGAPHGERVRASLQAVLASGVDYEVRTTVHPALLPAAALETLAAELLALGVRRYVLQACRPAARSGPDRGGAGGLRHALRGELAGRFPQFALREDQGAVS
jgi:pyruvate formate lyase activating enzyme